MDTPNAPQTILGLDPGTREMGFAVLKGRRLAAFGVITLRNGARPYDVIGQARKAVLELIQQYGPQIVVIEEPLPIPTRRGALLQVIAHEVHERAIETGARVVETTPQEARRRLTGNPLATKIEVAEWLVDRGLPQLRDRLPARPTRGALGLRPREKYWLHAFDALGLAVAVSGFDKTVTRP